MEIIRKDKRNITLLDAVKPGEVFRFMRGDAYFIKSKTGYLSLGSNDHYQTGSSSYGREVEIIQGKFIED